MRAQSETMFTSEADGTFTITKLSDGRVLGRLRDDEHDGWRAWLEDGTDARHHLGTYEDDGDAAAAIEEAARAAGML